MKKCYISIIAVMLLAPKLHSEDELGSILDAAEFKKIEPTPQITATQSGGNEAKPQGLAKEVHNGALQSGLSGPVQGKVSLSRYKDNQTEGIVKIRAKGRGDCPDSAEKNAIIASIRQAVGSLVDSKDIVKNMVLIESQVLTVSNGFVKEYTKVKERVLADNETYEVEIEALVLAGQVANTLKQANISVGKVGGANIWAEASSKVMNVEDARNYLEEKLPAYLTNLIVIEFLDANGVPTKDQNPISTNENAGDGKVSLAWIIRLKFNNEYYRSILPSVKHCYSILSNSSPVKFSVRGEVESVEKKFDMEFAPLGKMKRVFKSSDNININKASFRIPNFEEGYLVIDKMSKTGDFIEGEFFNLPKYQINIDAPLIFEMRLKNANGAIVSSQEWAVLNDVDNSFISLNPIMMSPVLTSKIWGNKVEIQDQKIIDAVFNLPINQAKEIDSIFCEIKTSFKTLKISDYQVGFPKSSGGKIIPKPW